ncbi:protein FAM131C [Rhineura floridana]|uniref:protein FAM131C n=1 Tax=Rhineura floridana TaxID=261503 RepID=UPI002AC857E9|nr:protein FAM131C [Rhineura floridana]
MGSCVTKEFFTSAHKEQPVAPQLDCPPAAPQGNRCPPFAPEKDDKEECLKDSSGLLPAGDTGSPSAYHVTALATSSLVGLVRTIKDHITKPTAMAQGRVAHLIEWKGWSAPRTGWEQALTDEEIYADLTDELKEAWFAAGVAAQFAIAEATLSALSSLDEEELNYGGMSQEAAALQDLGSIYPPGNLLLTLQGAVSPSNVTESLQAFSLSSCKSPAPNGHSLGNSWNSPMDSLGRAPPREGDQESPAGSLWLQQSATSLRYVDSSSLSEDEVFYN